MADMSPERVVDPSVRGTMLAQVSSPRPETEMGECIVQEVVDYNNRDVALGRLTVQCVVWV